ncbi:hypothetical protein DPMN_175185 [Dreissena polymorpha]|uniref:Uncharacterized protein n=1 Tax=Dreissena polymorpha TaxID=45954 RepID=A0A9D4E7E0_DREPO|nr:hypothetical protein DPMN_175185 [Dreissena polymorpha]
MVEAIALPLGISQRPLRECTCLRFSTVLIRTNMPTLKLSMQAEIYRDPCTMVKKVRLQFASACRPSLRLRWETRSGCGLYLLVRSIILAPADGTALLGC